MSGRAGQAAAERCYEHCEASLENIWGGACMEDLQHSNKARWGMRGGGPQNWLDPRPEQAQQAGLKAGMIKSRTSKLQLIFLRWETCLSWPQVRAGGLSLKPRVWLTPIMERARLPAGLDTIRMATVPQKFLQVSSFAPLATQHSSPSTNHPEHQHPSLIRLPLRMITRESAAYNREKRSPGCPGSPGMPCSTQQPHLGPMPADPWDDVQPEDDDAEAWEALEGNRPGGPPRPAAAPVALQQHFSQGNPQPQQQWRQPSAPPAQPPSDAPLCACGLPSNRLTSNTAANPGRRVRPVHAGIQTREGRQASRRHLSCCMLASVRVASPLRQVHFIDHKGCLALCRNFFKCPKQRDDPTNCRFFKWADELDAPGGQAGRLR